VFARGVASVVLVATTATSALLYGLAASAKVLVIALPVIPVILAQRMFPAAEHDTQEVSTAIWLGAYLVVCGISLLVLLTRYRRADG
jgi:uncharacterized membrane protein YdcZ (DUF606 family)